ncbi:8b6d8822-44ae-44c0-8db4-8e55e1d52bd8-CDS [Sclerotinia trifoliorum]|uniref:8b6d8822-44ae-44c0-8db4-8e55e1d52bd8-CDS n=1 Tax=Sclerotinia trifoliorum TaxID=28548 RepID=A0A8H2VX26_9HELO|nr:8b6d8822-44ae-44c0-8db4-8e55e1d52bd8-CDS [Sclerotinia trifoliorum]
MPVQTFYTSVAPPPKYNFNRPGSTRIASAPNLLISTESHGIGLKIISPGGIMSPEHPEFDNIVRAAIDIASDGAPRLSVGKLYFNPILLEEIRDVTLVSRDGKETLLFVEIFSGHKYRFKAIKDMLQSVDAAVLDSDKCSICMEPYDAADADKFNDHRASKLPECGHIFGRDCITNWLELNDTCPMCREEVELTLEFDLQVWVDCDWQML